MTNLLLFIGVLSIPDLEASDHRSGFNIQNGMTYIPNGNSGGGSAAPVEGVAYVDRKRHSDIGLRDLRVLSVLLRERNLTRAAELLGTTQPSVSKVLARLRAHFDDRLFVWAGGSMQPTRRARQIANPLHVVLVGFDALTVSTAPFDPAVSAREFRLLLTDVGMIVFLPRLTEQIREAGSDLRINAMPFDARRVSSLLESSEADLAIGDLPDAARGLRRQRLYHDNFLSVVRKDHPQRASLAHKTDFLAERHILVKASHTGHAAHEAIERGLEAELSPDRIQLRLPSFLASAAVVKHTDAIATMPGKLARFVAKELDLVAFSPPLALPSIEIAQLWHERMQDEPGHRWLRMMIFSLFRE
jgi:DNA-binding transcriptional LysR family regulator